MSEVGKDGDLDGVCEYEPSSENDSRDEPEDIDDADDKNHYQFWKSSKSQEEKKTVFPF